MEKLQAALTRTCQALSDSPDIQADLQPTARPEFGDFSSPVALDMAGRLGQAPVDIAEDIVAGLGQELGDQIDRIEVVAPGFVNIFLADRWFCDALRDLDGRSAPIVQTAQPERILLEFVSANPTGPLTVASGRHAAYGDALARLLRAVGNDVQTEYYVNDTGGQIGRLAASVAARMVGDPPPEDGYHGDYIAGLAESARRAGIEPERAEQLTEHAVQTMLAGIRESLQRFGVRIDEFFLESSLIDNKRMGLYGSGTLLGQAGYRPLAALLVGVFPALSLAVPAALCGSLALLITREGQESPGRISESK